MNTAVDMMIISVLSITVYYVTVRLLERLGVIKRGQIRMTMDEYSDEIIRRIPPSGANKMYGIPAELKNEEEYLELQRFLSTKTKGRIVLLAYGDVNGVRCIEIHCAW